jgi:hypothetical protein
MKRIMHKRRLLKNVSETNLTLELPKGNMFLFLMDTDHGTVNNEHTIGSNPTDEYF